MQKTCVIIPCYNEASRLDLREFETFIGSHENIDFLFVNDGSTDDTGLLVKKFKSEFENRIFLLDLLHNSGKAEAVRRGVLEANKNGYHFIGFWDADLATPLSEIRNFLDFLHGKNKTMVIGCRLKRLGATVERSAVRHYVGRVFATFASIILKMPVYDTQCGAKIFKAEMAALFEEAFITKWLFDIEILARYRNAFGIKKTLEEVAEFPVNAWLEKGNSKIKTGYLFKLPFELFAIKLKYNKQS